MLVSNNKIDLRSKIGSTAKSSTEEYVERKLDISKITGTYVDGVIKNAEDGLLEKLVKQ